MILELRYNMGILGEMIGRLAQKETTWLPFGLPTNLLLKAMQPYVVDMALSSTGVAQCAWGAGTITFADGSTQSITTGSRSDLSTTHYAYFITGNSTIQWSTNFGDTIAKDRGLLAIVVKGNASSLKSLILPAHGKEPVLNALVLYADLILAQHIKAGELVLGGKVTGTLDNVDDGATHSRVLTTDITAGHILLSSVTQAEGYRTVSDTEKGTWNQASADAAQAISDAATAQGTADGKVVTFYQDAAPTAEGTGDLWIDTNDGNKLYRWSGATWVEVQDDAIATAIANAATAQSTADSKIVTFYQTSAPTAGETGDFWVDTDDHNTIYRWSGTEWILVAKTLKETLIEAGHIRVGSGTKDSTLDGWDINTDEIVGQLDGADQVRLGTDGKIYAGAGAAILDADGLSIKGFAKALYFKDAGGDIEADIWLNLSEQLQLDCDTQILLNTDVRIYDGGSISANSDLDIKLYGGGTAQITLN